MNPLEWKPENFEKLTESAKHILEKKRPRKKSKKKKGGISKRMAETEPIEINKRVRWDSMEEDKHGFDQNEDQHMEK